jgi:serine acetyltransferase
MTTDLPPLTRARKQLDAFREDLRRLVDLSRRAGRSRPRLTALADPSVPVLAMIRGAAAARALVGSSLGLSRVLVTVFHVDVWTDEIGGGLRLPHPFQIVLGDGARVGSDCTLMHNVTIQRGAGTRVEDGAVLGTGVVVLAGAHVGQRALIGANSVVRGTIGSACVAVGAPARVLRVATSQGASS